MSNLDPFNWKILKEERVFDSFRKVKKYTYKMPDGSTNEWFIKEDGKSAVMLAFTPSNEIILFKQYRPGPQKIMYEMPGGAVDNNEMPDKAALRELEEETGYTSTDITTVGSMFKDAYSSGETFAFIAKNCVKQKTQNHDHGEFGKLILVSVDQFKKLLRSGQLTDSGLGYACLDQLELL